MRGTHDDMTAVHEAAVGGGLQFTRRPSVVRPLPVVNGVGFRKQRGGNTPMALMYRAQMLPKIQRWAEQGSLATL